MAVGSKRPSRATLYERLRACSDEIEQTIFARAHHVSDPSEVGDPNYVDGLRAAVSAGVAYGLAGIEGTGSGTGAVPGELLAQARHAARSRVSLDTVLRRYFAGYTVLGDFLIGEAAHDKLLGADEFRRLLHLQAELFDRLIVTVTEEYTREATERMRSSEQRRAECVRRLLAGEPADASELAYDLDGWHIGLIATGRDAGRALRALADSLGRRLLVVNQGGTGVWAWLGGRRAPEVEELDRVLSEVWLGEGLLAIGDASHGLSGWRLTHRQASAAYRVATRRSDRPAIRYSDVVLLTAALHDDLLRESLQRIFLAPLGRERDGGSALRKTLRAYFAAGRHVSSTASALGVSRQTVSNRLRAVEEHLQRPLGSCSAELETALLLAELEDSRSVSRVLPRGR
jgi:hypothetical protein